MPDAFEMPATADATVERPNIFATAEDTQQRLNGDAARDDAHSAFVSDVTATAQPPPTVPLRSLRATAKPRREVRRSRFAANPGLRRLGPVAALAMALVAVVALTLGRGNGRPSVAVQPASSW